MYGDSWWSNFTDRWGGLLLAIGILAVSVLIGYWITSSVEAKRKVFMDACMQDRKWYECESMWRAGRPNTYVQPAPIIIHR